MTGRLVLAMGFVATLLAAGRSASADDRSTILLRHECRSTIGRREVTLFANGTVRLRDGAIGKETMTLGEVGASEVQAFVARLEAENGSELEGAGHGAEGDWIEHCVLELSLAGRPAKTVRYGRYDSLSLSLSRILRVVDDLARVATAATGEHLPASYRPVEGDVLRRFDGEEYEIVGFTADKKGVELRGRRSPLTLYVPMDAVPREFVALISRRRPR